MQIQLPDDLKVSARARAAGFSTVEDYIRDLVERDAKCVDVPPETTVQESKRPGKMPYEEWKQRLDAFVARHKPTGRPLDDRRESLYD